MVRQIRQAMPGVEIMLMTGAFGTVDPRGLTEWQSTVDPDGPSYRSCLMRLAMEEKCEFLDMEGAWGDYIRATDKPISYFMRDVVHGNDRGRQPVARVLVEFFSPKQ